MAGEKKRLLENFISLGALQIVSYIIPLINLPYLSRVLSVEHFGLVFFAQAFMWYFMVITDFGFELSATREIAINRHNSKTISNIFNSVLTIKILLIIICYLILSILSIFIPKVHDNWLLFQLSFLMVVGYSIYPTWFFQGMEKMKYITFLKILAQVIFVLLIFVFVKNDNNYLLVPLFNSLGFIISAIIGFFIAVKQFGIVLYIPKIKSINKQFKYSSAFFLSRISVTALSNTNTFCIGLIEANTLVGYYVAAERVATAIKGLQVPLKNALYPYIAKYKDLKLYKRIFKIAVLTNVLICSIMFIFAKDFITIFYGAEMLNAYKIFRIFCFVIVVTAPSTLMGYPLLGAMGFTDEANRSVVFASIFHFIGLGVLYFLNVMSVYSIVYLTLVSETILWIQWGYYVYKYKLLSNGGNKI